MDQNCDGVLGVISSDDATGQVYAPNNESDYLGSDHSLSLFDYNDDGQLDVAVTGAFILSSGSGGGYLIDGSNYGSWDDTTENLYDMAIYSSGTYAYVSQVSQEQGDIDGNGVADLVIAGTDRYRAYQGSYTEQAVSIFFDSTFQTVSTKQMKQASCSTIQNLPTVNQPSCLQSTLTVMDTAM